MKTISSLSFVLIMASLLTVAEFKSGRKPRQYKGGSLRAQRFLSFFSGDWSNKEQVEQEGSTFKRVDVRNIPVNTSLFNEPTFLREEARNGVVSILQLAVVRNNGRRSLKVQFYGLTNITQYKPRQYQVESLSNLTKDDLRVDDECYAQIQFENKYYLTGYHPQCDNIVNGTHPHYATTYTCDQYTVDVPVNLSLAAPTRTFIFKRAGLKYPLFNLPKHFKDPCAE